MLLCGDIGGTKTTLALFAVDRLHEPLALATYASREAPGLDAIVAGFVARERPRLEAACFGIAGPVLDGRVETTNLPWVVESTALGAELGGVPVYLLNDLEALANGVGLVPETRLATLNAGVPGRTGNAAVIAAGTGLGEAGLAWDGERHVPFASEGGHADFAPRTEQEIALLRHLRQHLGHVSYERVLSGPGLVHIFDFLRDVEGHAEPPARGDGPAAITAAALAGHSPIAVAALDLFVSIYGAEAGNLALKLKATAGVYVGGGIAPKILPKLTDGAFRAAFLDKGRFASFLADVPVRVVLEEHVALWGAARHAAARLAAG
jgi:glucokinase